MSSRTNARSARLGIGLLALSIAAAALLAPRPAHGQAAGSARGVVVDVAVGTPLAGALVTLAETGMSATTGPEGTFTIDGIPPGMYTLTVIRDGYAPLTTPVTVSAGAATPLELRLAAAQFEERVRVTGIQSEFGLAEETDTGSRLGLRAMDIPASIDVIDSTVMQTRGFQRIGDALETVPGVLAGHHPAAPSSFSVRGFTRSQITVLRDGVWLGPANMVMRPQNAFNLDRVELLRGPASVLNGQGAVAGTVNAVTRQAMPTTAPEWNALFSYGRFNTYQTAVGVNGPISDSLWYRFDASRYGSDGYVDRMRPSSSNVTGNLLWRPASRAQFRFSVDYLDDDVGSYFGTPLLPASAIGDPLDVITTTTGEGIDARTRFLNYNVTDAVNDSSQLLVRTDAEVQLSDQVTLRNTLYGFDAQRNWQNAEGFPYCTAVVDVCTTVGQIQRYYGYFSSTTTSNCSGIACTSTSGPRSAGSRTGPRSASRHPRWTSSAGAGSGGACRSPRATPSMSSTRCPAPMDSASCAASARRTSIRGRSSPRTRCRWATG